MKVYRFYRSGRRWYVDLPEWTGSIDDLEMVSGADDMLDIMSEYKNEINVTISLTEFVGSNVLELLDDLGEEGGSVYKLKYYNGIYIDLEIWLCPVMLFVFGAYPKKIYINSCNI